MARAWLWIVRENFVILAPSPATRAEPSGTCLRENEKLAIPEAGASGLGKQTVLTDLARYYDVLVDWEKRLAREMPLLRKVLAEVPRNRGIGIHPDMHVGLKPDNPNVLVAGCGTGGHVVALAREGFEVVGIDSDPAMVEATQKKLDAAAEEIPCPKASGGSPTLRASARVCAIEDSAALSERFGAALCLGNTLPNLSAPGQLEAAMRALYEVLLPGGIFFTQNLNYDKRWREKSKWFPVLSGRTHAEEVILFKVAEYNRDFLDFHTIFLVRPVALRPRSGQASDASTSLSAGRRPSAQQEWEYRVTISRQIPLFEKELRTLLERIGFKIVSAWSDYSGAPFDAQDSSDLLLLSRRPGVVPSR